MTVGTPEFARLNGVTHCSEKPLLGTIVWVYDHGYDLSPPWVLGKHILKVGPSERNDASVQPHNE